MAKRAKKAEEEELSDVGKLMVKTTLEDDKLRREILEDLKKNPKYKEYFKDFNKQTVNMFIKMFADAKFRYLKYGEMYLKQEDQESSRYKARAEQYFWQIQQKKLFDKQCLWRAEKITIDEIEIGEQFEYWGEAIKTCPFIEPVTETEFNLFLDFINSDQYRYDNNYDYASWQDHFTLKDAEEEDDDEMPDYYRFHNIQTGSGELIKLPDIRGAKEDKYIQITQAQRTEVYHQEHPEIPKPEYDIRPQISFGEQQLMDFIKKFDDPIIQKYHELIDRGEYDDEGFPSLSIALNDLKDAEIPIPVAEGDCWQDVIINSMSQHEVRMLNKVLPIVFDEYQFRVQNNIGFGYTDDETEGQKSKTEMIEDHFKKNILEGRRLNGEPQDFKF